MKKKNNEIAVLCFLVAVFICYGFYTFMLSPKLQEAKELETQIQSNDMIVREMYNTILSSGNKLEELKAKSQQVRGMTEQFYVNNEQEEYFEMLDGHIKKEGMIFSGIRAGENADFEAKEQYADSNPYGIYDSEEDKGTQDQEQTKKDKQAKPVVQLMNIDLETTGAYAKAQSLIEQLNASSKKIYSGDLIIEMAPESLETKEKNPDVRMSQTLSFVRIVNLTSLDVDFSTLDGSDYAPPEEFVNGSYRDLFSTQNWWSAIRNAFNL